MESYHRLEQLLQSYVTNYTEPNLFGLTTNLEKLNAAQIAKAVTFTTAVSGATSGLTVIHIAAVNNHAALIQIILDAVTSVTRCELLSIQDSREWTALHYAAYKRNEAVVTAMLAKLTPEDIFDLLKIQDLNGHTALHSAVQNQQSELLLQPVKFDKPNPQNRKDTYNGLLKSLLGRVSQANLLELLQIQNEWNETAVHLAISNEQTDAMQLLETELPHLYQQMLLAIHNGEKKPIQDASAKGKVQTDFTIITKREASNTNREGRIAKENEDEVDFLPLSHKSKLDDDLDQAKLQRPPGIAKKNEDEVHLLSLCHKLTAGTRDQKDYHRPPAFSCLLREDRPTEDRPTEDRPTEDRPTEAFPFTQEYGCKKKKRWPKVDLGKGDIYLLMLKFWKFLSKKHGQSQQKDTECYQAAHDNEKLIVQRSDDIPGISQLGENEEIWTGGRWSNQWKSGDQQIIQLMQKVLLQECNKIQAMDEGICKPEGDADTEVVEVNNFSYTPKETAKAVAVTNTAEVGTVDELEVKMKVEMEEDSVENGCSILEEADKDMGQEMSVVTAAVGERRSVDEGDETKVKNVRILIVYITSHGQKEEPHSEDLEWTVGHGSYRCIIDMAIWTGWPSYSPDDDDEATNQETDTIYIRQIVGYILLAVGNGLSIVNSTSAEPLAHNRHRRTYRNNEDSKKGLPEHKDDARHASEKALCSLQLSNAGARGDDNKGNATSLSPTVYPKLGLSADEVISAADQSEKIDQGWVQSINNAETRKRYQGLGALCSWTLCLATQLVTVIAHMQHAVWYSIVTRVEPTEFPDLKEEDAALLPHTSPEVAGYIHSNQLEWMFYPFRRGISCAVPYAQPCDVVCYMADMQTYNQNGGQGEENVGGDKKGGQGEENSGGDKNGGQGEENSGGDKNGGQGEENSGGDKNGGQGEENSGGDKNGGQGEESSGGDKKGGQGEENGGGDKNGGQGEGNNGRGEENGGEDCRNEKEEKDKMCPRESLPDFLKDHALERKKLLLVERQRSFLYNCLQDNVKMSQKYIAQTPSSVPDSLKWIFDPSLHGISSAVPPPPSYLTDVLCYPAGHHGAAVPDQLPVALQHQLDKRDITTETSGELLEDSGDLKDAEEQNGMQPNEKESSLPAASVNELVDGERLDVLLEPDSVLVQEFKLAKLKIDELKTELAGYQSDAGRGSHELRDTVEEQIVSLTGVEVSSTTSDGTHNKDIAGTHKSLVNEHGDDAEHNSSSHSVEDGDEPDHNSSSHPVEHEDESEHKSPFRSVEHGDEPEHNSSSQSAEDRDESEHNSSSHSVEDGDEPEHNLSSHSVEGGDEPEHNSSSQSAEDGDKPEHNSSSHSVEDGDEPEHNSSSHSVEDGDEPDHNSSSHSVEDGDEPEHNSSSHSVEDGDEPEHNSSSQSVEDGDEPEHNSSSHSAEDGDELEHNSSAHSVENGDEPEHKSSSHSAEDGDEPEHNSSSHSAEDGDEPEHNSSFLNSEMSDEIKGITEDMDTPFQDTVVESKHSAVVDNIQPDSVLMQELELAKLKIAELETELTKYQSDAGRGSNELKDTVEGQIVLLTAKLKNANQGVQLADPPAMGQRFSSDDPDPSIDEVDSSVSRRPELSLQDYPKSTEYSAYEKVVKMLAVYVSNGYTPDTSELKQYLQAISADDRFELLKRRYGWSNYSALYKAAERGDTEVMRCLLKMVEPQKRYELLKIRWFGGTPLHVAASRGRTEVMRCMLELIKLENQIQLLDIANYSSMTALDVAEGEETVQLIRQYRESAEREIADCYIPMLHFSPLFRYQAYPKSINESSYEKVEKMLAEYVSDPRYTPDTPELKQYLQAVSADERFELLKKQYGWSDYTALHKAAERGDTEVMRCLLELVEPEKQIQLLDIPNMYNKTTLDVAKGEKTVQLIRQYRESDERETADKMNPRAFGHPPTDGALHWRQSNVNNNNPSAMSYCEKLEYMLADYVYNPWHTLDTSELKQYLQAISADLRFELLKENGTTTIHEAAERGHTRVITALLEMVEPERRCELLKIQNRCGNPALNTAAERDDARVMRCLLEQVEPGSVYELLKIRNESPFRYGTTAIEEAAWRGHTKVMNAMLAMVEPENQIELLDIPYWHSRTRVGEKMAKVIHQYRRRAEFAVMEKLERLLAVYVYVPWSRLNTSELQQCLQAFSAGKRFELLKKQCGRGTTALHQAAKRGHTEVMRCLLKLVEARKRHELLKKQDFSSSTPLHAAARSGGTEAVRCMLELVELEDQVQLLNTPNWLSRTALDVAKGHKPTQIMRQCGESTAGKFRESPRRQRTATEGGCLLESHLHPTSRAFAMPCKDDANTLNEPISTGDPHHGERSHKVPMVEKAIEPTQVVREETAQATEEERENSVLQQNALGDNTPVSLIPSNVVFQSDQSSLSLSESVPRPASTYQEEPSCSAPNVHGFQSSKIPSKQPLAGNHLKSVDCKLPSIGANILQDTKCGSSANERKYFALTTAHSLLSENDVEWIFNPSRHGISSAILSYNREIACYPIARYPDNQNPLLPLSLQKKLAEMSPREYLSAVLRELSLEERESLMIDEKQRRNTFLVNWPHDSNLSGVKLAQAGFYCVDDYDRVQCVFCRGSLHKWEAEDNPMTEHAKLFPFCRFVKGLECGNKEYKNDLLLADELKNITLLTMPEMKKNRDGSVSTNSGAFGISTNKAAVIKYAPYETRKNTYGRWPAANVIRPEPLCEAGFYYTGFDDQVRCFFCSGGLREWSSEDNPWEEHARWFPDCSYLLQHKGEIYVTEVHARTEDGKKCPRKTVLQKKTEKEWKQKVSTQQAMYELIVVKLNHDRRAVDIAINRNGKTFESAKEMVEAVYQVEEDGNMDSDRMETDYQAIKPAIDFMAAAAKDQPIIVQEAGMGTDMVDGLQPGRMDTADSGPPPASCKTCYKKTSQVVQASQVGLPCGHLIYCDKCIQDEKLKTDRNNGYKSRCPAPQCAAVLTGAIKAFLN